MVISLMGLIVILAQMGLMVKNARPLVMDFFMVTSAAIRASAIKNIVITYMDAEEMEVLVPAWQFIPRSRPNRLKLRHRISLTLQVSE